MPKLKGGKCMYPINQQIMPVNQGWGSVNQEWIPVNQNLVPLNQLQVSGEGFGGEQVSVIARAGVDLVTFNVDSQRKQLNNIDNYAKAHLENTKQLFASHIINTNGKNPDEIQGYTGELARQLNLSEVKFINILPTIIDLYEKQRNEFQKSQFEIIDKSVEIRGELIKQTLDARAQLIIQAGDVEKIKRENEKAIQDMAKVAKEFENEQKRIDNKLDREFELAKGMADHTKQKELIVLEKEIKIAHHEQQRLDLDQLNKHKADEHARKLEQMEKAYLQKLGLEEAGRKWEGEQRTARDNMLNQEFAIHMQMHQSQIQVAQGMKDKFGKNMKYNAAVPKIDKENGVVIPGHVNCEGENFAPAPLAPPAPRHRKRRFNLGRLACKLIGL